MSQLKNTLLKIPGVGRPMVNLIWSVKKKFISFQGSGNYWEHTYQTGGNSGEGSYNRLAVFKADVINDFLKKHQIQSAIEFGCGDGNQLALIQYPNYIGLDVSPTAIVHNMAKFKNDPTKSFYVYQSLAFKDQAGIFKADISLSLDVIYHLIEDEIFDAYMRHLFAAARRYVVIFSSNFSKPQDHHERDRVFTDWVKAHVSDWELMEHIPNKYPYDKADPENTSKADFFIYRPVSAK